GESPAEPKQEAAASAATEPAPVASPPSASPLPGPPPVEASYECVPVMKLDVTYDNTADPPRAIVSVDGKTYNMQRALSASGARYMTLEGRSPGMALVWWNKGQEGFLQEGKGEAMAEDTILATCVEKSS
ncbi:MAG TPA: MliC family protein, partial [Hyphomonadaceae bacterium]|nr:MliC family protein [Hyphomonadaceae bacterium]